MTKTETALVSIGITAYNAADTIGRAIESALSQDWPNREIIVVDDASSDATADIVERLAATHPSIRLARTMNNQGVAAARNRLVEEARGEFLVFFDDDDVSTPDRVRRQVERIEQFEPSAAPGALVICHTARKQVLPDGSVVVVPTMGSEGVYPPSGYSVAERVITGVHVENAYGACATCSQAARVSLYRSLGGFDPNFRRSEDSDLVVRLAKAGGYFVGISDPLVTQSMTPTSEKSIRDEHRFFLQLLDKHRDVADRSSMYGFCRRWIDLKYAWLAGSRGKAGLIAAELLIRHPIAFLSRYAQSRRNKQQQAAYARFVKMTSGT